MRIFIYILSALSLVLFGGCIRTQADIKAEQSEAARQQAIQNNIANTEDTIQQLRREVGQLRGKVEETNYYRNQDKTETGKVIEDLRKTVIELSDKVANMSNVQTALYEEIKKMKEASIKRMQAPKRSSSRRGKGSLLQQADGLRKRGKHNDAIRMYREYLEKNPKTRYRHSTNYKMGESLFAIRQYKQAIVAYSVAHELGMKSRLGRQATLRIAQCLHRTGKKTEAGTFVDLLLQGAPQSAEASTAKKIFKR